MDEPPTKPSISEADQQDRESRPLPHVRDGLLEALLGEQNRQGPYFWYKKEKVSGKNGPVDKLTFDVEKLGKAILECFPAIHMIDSDDLFLFLFDHFDMNGEHYVGRIVNTQLGDLFTVERLNRTIAYLKTVSHENCQHVKTHDELLPPDYLIPFKNGIYDLNKDRLEPYTKDHFFPSRLNIVYDPAAKCPVFDNFILGSVPNQIDRMTLQEYNGVCLTHGSKYRASVFCLGPSHSGKSTYAKVLHAAWKDYATAIPLQTLIERGNTGEFARAQLFGKLINVFPDIPKAEMEDDSWFLSLTGDDEISARTPCHSPFKFAQKCGQFYTANKLPKSRNHGDEFFVRTLFVEFPISRFPNTDTPPDEDLITKLTTEQELSGFANWLLEGLQRLRKTHVLTRRFDIDETREMWEQNSDVVSRFAFSSYINDKDPSNVVSKDRTHSVFLKFCDEQKERPIPKEQFFEELKEHFPRANFKYRPKVGDKRPYSIQGLTINDGKEEKPVAQHLLGEFLDVREGHLEVCEMYRSQTEDNRVLVVHCANCGDKAVYVVGDSFKLDLLKCRKGEHQGLVEDRLERVIKKGGKP